MNGMENCSSVLIFFQVTQCFIFDPSWRPRGVSFVKAIQTDNNTKTPAQSTLAAAASFLSNPFSEVIATQNKQESEVISLKFAIAVAL